MGDEEETGRDWEWLAGVGAEGGEEFSGGRTGRHMDTCVGRSHVGNFSRRQGTGRLRGSGKHGGWPDSGGSVREA